MGNPGLHAAAGLAWQPGLSAINRYFHRYNRATKTVSGCNAYSRRIDRAAQIAVAELAGLKGAAGGKVEFHNVNAAPVRIRAQRRIVPDRKSTRLNSSHRT